MEKPNDNFDRANAGDPPRSAFCGIGRIRGRTPYTKLNAYPRSNEPPVVLTTFNSTGV